MVLVSAVRPAALRERRSIAGTGSRRAPRRMARSVANAYRRSAGDQKPPGERAVTERTRFSRAISRASSPPRELPATCGRSTPSASHIAPSAGTIVASPYASPSGRTGDRPNPGRSTAITSYSAARISNTGSQACRW